MRAAGGKGNSCQIINISETKAMKRQQIDEWLDRKVAERYGDKDVSTVKNPTLRLMTLFDLLEGEAKHAFYSYVRVAAAQVLGEQIMREQFWACMSAASSEWEAMEEYGKELACEEKTYVVK